MSDYLRWFYKDEQYQSERDSDYKKPWVSYTQQTKDVNYDPIENSEEWWDIYGKEMPFTFSILSSGNVVLSSNSGAPSITLEYKKNDEDWVQVTTEGGESSTTISVVTNDILQFRGNNNAYGNASWWYTFKNTTATFDVYGNIMSLVNSTNYKNIGFNSNYAFRDFFSRCQGLINAKHLILPKSTTMWCYFYMFYNCSNLLTCPKLPATNLAAYCYQQMFASCKKIVSAPELPATTLQAYCYNNMFADCIDLITPPQLPATTIKSWCYAGMFSGCYSLKTAPELPATSLYESCYRNMFYNCYELVSGPSQLPATTLQNYCYYNMFYKCSRLVNPPEILATTLAYYCCYNMFFQCVSLERAPQLLARKLSVECYTTMFNTCSKLNYVKAMFTTTPGTGFTTNWLNGAKATGTFVKNAAAAWNTRDYSSIPEGWTIEYDYSDVDLVEENKTLTILTGGYPDLSMPEGSINSDDYKFIFISNNGYNFEYHLQYDAQVSEYSWVSNAASGTYTGNVYKLKTT